MIDTLTSLAFSVNSSKGVYALLLGSGLSTPAGIPTGWDITLDLIRKSAAANNEDCGDDPASWFKGKTGRDADYSELLDLLAKTPADRANLLAGYFEPTDEDIANGLKAPTPAHQAIARLVSKGYVRVIVTTNFDRLIERALETHGISPAVVSTADGARGALPLAHARCTVVKVHGDYRDTRIKNTLAELESYEPEMDALLDRIFDEYGLVVCGWSAKWDKALCRAVLRSPNHRFTTYWSRRGILTSDASVLVTQRRAVELEIVSADAFFSGLETKIDAIERYSEPHPMSAKLAVASLKKFIVDERNRIQLYDLVSAETERAYAAFSQLPLGNYTVTIDQVFERMKIYENSVATLVSLFGHAGFWSEALHQSLWDGCISRIADVPRSGVANTELLKLRMYPTCLLFYSIGIGAVARQNYKLLNHLSRNTAVRQDGEDRPLNRVHPWYVLDLVSVARRLPGYENKLTPVNDRIRDVLREPLREYLPSDTGYDDIFDRFEYLVALVQFDIGMGQNTTLPEGSPIWGPPGRFGWRNRETKPVEDRILEEANKDGERCPIIQQGLFSSMARFRAVEKAYRDNVLAPTRRGWY